ncbi:MAG: amidohydrolase family protein [Gemmatimonadota bacterium]|nr:MAG: amidohydrolase family protein [Gemmatimonadota bacterium]
MLIDVHAHFYTERSGRADWQTVNAARLDAGRRIGITAHVASILGSWGASSPTYFPSPEDVTHANDRMVELLREHREIHGYCVVNPNYTDHALGEIEQRLEQGMIGVKLAASRRASDKLLDPIASLAGERGVPILHHVWHFRRRDWSGQEASDASELAALAERHLATDFIMAHLGGGGDWSHSLRVVREVPNIWVDLSGSGVDVDMLDAAVREIGSARLLWGADITLGTAWAKLRYLESCDLAGDDLDLIKYGNAFQIFPAGVFRDGD